MRKVAIIKTEEFAMADDEPKSEVGVEDAQQEDVAQAESTADVAVAPANEQPVEEQASDSSEVTDDADDEISDEEIAEMRANETAYSWQASEYVQHNKQTAWFLALFGGLAALILVLVFMHAWLEIGLFVAMGVATVMYAIRPPRNLNYELSPKGVTIEGKFYPFSEFRAFSVIEDMDWHVIDLEPVKRFSPRLSILFDSSNVDEIVGHLALHLSRIDREPDPIERLARYVRF